MNIIKNIWQHGPGIEEQFYPESAESIIMTPEANQWYFYSKEKRRVLRKKKQNTTTEKIIQWHQRKTSIIPNDKICFLVLIVDQDNIAEFVLYNRLESIQLIKDLHKKQFRSVTFTPLIGMQYQHSLIKTYWTPNYCLCEQDFRQLFFSKGKLQEYQPTIQTKQLLSKIALNIQTILNRGLDTVIKQMQVIFLKNKHYSKPLLLCARIVKSNEKLLCNYTFKTSNPISKQPQNQIIKAGCFKCTICKSVNNKNEVHKITRNSVHKMQIKSAFKFQIQQIPDLMNKPINRNRRLIHNNYYEQVPICVDCFKRFSEEVKKQERYIRANSQKSSKKLIQNIDIRGINSKRSLRNRYTTASSRGGGRRQETLNIKQIDESLNADFSTISYTYVRINTTSFSRPKDQ